MYVIVLSALRRANAFHRVETKQHRLGGFP